ncbi:MAG: type II/IV secretion system ATPase subunit [Candidatus Aenigmatarchaeota archaeon]|nr:MAG: type II/IV secretion system ATPase subunit [Candidatus Aenigmarchaeota archaeon]
MADAVPEAPPRYELKDTTLRVRPAGLLYESGVEDSDACMAQVVDALAKNKSAQSVAVVGTREYEYSLEETQMLKDVARALEEIIRGAYLSVHTLGEYRDYVADDFAYVQALVMTKLLGDPLGVYVDLKRRTRHINVRARSVEGKRTEAYNSLMNNVIVPVLQILENTSLVRNAKPFLTGYKIGDRSAYRQLFHPTVRPVFMQTRYQTEMPEGAEIVDRYALRDGVEVEIYRVRGSVRYVYHAIPPEFRLSEDQYTILDAARRYMIEHKPREIEFADPERMREIFANIGRDLVTDIANQMGLSLTRDETERLTSILTRYTAGLGVLEILLSDEKIQDVYINSPIGQNPIYVFHQDYQECVTNFIPTQEDAESWATRFRLVSGRPLDEANPVLDTEVVVPGGRARVAIVTRTLSPQGLGFSLRRHRDDPWTYPLFIHPKTRYFNELFAGLMSFIVDYSRTFLIAGTRSSGKTSLLNASLLEVMRKYRIVTVEDTLEIPVNRLRALGYNVESLKSRSVITQVETELPADEAIRTSLRLGDSVLIIGEVRSLEAKALYEAMRIGALANTVAGTIHGDSPYGVFDRVVNDLGVPPTSFKATDLIIICNMMKSADGIHRFRRVTSVTEVRKHWKNDPQEEGGFVPLLQYSSKEDILKPTDTLLNGESFILNEVASSVREWSGNWQDVWENILLRGRIKKAITEYAIASGKPDFMEAPFVVESNDIFHLVSEQLRAETGSIPAERAYNAWYDWFKARVKY